jgi:putative heme-binding domain-containing protein
VVQPRLRRQWAGRRTVRRGHVPEGHRPSRSTCPRRAVGCSTSRRATIAGRIYRIAASGRPPAAFSGLPANAPVEALVDTLADPNAWRRETAQRLIVERQASEAIPLLRGLLTSADDRARLHALWTLEGLSSLTDDDLTAALRNTSPAVRENAVRLAEERIARSRALADAVIALAHDADPRVRFRAALALGDLMDDRVVPALAAIARADGDDRWVRAAVLSGIGGRAAAFLHAFAGGPPPSDPVRAAVMEDLGQVIGAAGTVDERLAFIARVTNVGGDADWQPGALAGLARGLGAGRGAGEGASALAAMLAGDAPRVRAARLSVDRMMARAATTAGDPAQPEDVRVRAIELAAYADWRTTGDTLVRLIDPREPTAVQVAAVRALGRMREPLAAASLVEADRWRAYTPHVREAVLATLLAEDRHVRRLLDALARGDVNAMSIGPARRTRLRGHKDDAIRQRAAELLGAVEEPRMAVYDRVRREALAGTGDAVRGARVYTTHCARCHTFDADGVALGPDLSGLSNQPAEAILLHILVPDYEITPGYESYAVDTRDGRTLVGRLESEAPNSLTLRTAAGEQQVVLRSDVDSVSALPASLMPGNLEQVLSARELADLIAYLKRQPSR